MAQLQIASTRVISGHNINFVNLDAKSILNRNFIIYGGSGQGKTTCLKSLLYQIKGEVSHIIAFSPTDRSNNNYAGIIPPIFVHFDFNLGVLRAAYNQQKDRFALFKEANQVDNLKRLYKHVSSEENDRIINRLNTTFGDKINDLNNKLGNDSLTLQQELNAAKKNHKEVLIKIYRAIIKEKAHSINQEKLDADLRLILIGCLINPHLIVVMDDCASEFKGLKGEDLKMFYEIYFQGRHHGMTTFLLTQDDSIIDKKMRDNAHVWIFTGAAPLAGAMARRGAWSAPVVKTCSAIVTGWERKELVEAGKWTTVCIFKVLADTICVYNFVEATEFRMCPDSIWEYAKRVQVSQTEVLANNNFLKKFTN